MEACAIQRLSGWGRYPVEECHVYRPEKRRSVAPLLTGCEGEQTFIPRGLGHSYGDPALNQGGGVIDYSRLNRMLAFDAATGVLECEAGVSMAEILDTFVPRGFFPSVLPGTKHPTVGGAIANDIHGKNHHQDGTFSQFVEDLDLLTPTGETLVCSAESNADVFWATVGGIGLTGVILKARIRLQPIETAYVMVDYVRTNNIEETLAAFAESDGDYTYSVAWVDCLSRGPRLGRSILMRANHAPRSAMPPSMHNPLQVKPKWQKTVPFDFPSFVLNATSVGLFNSVWYALSKSVSHRLEDFDTYFCPLDSIRYWNRMYGKRGFVQYQIVLPADEGRGLVGLLEKVNRSRHPSFLAVLKRLGPAGPGLLSFPFEGYTLTLDIPVGKGLVEFLRDLDRFLLAHGGRLYCAKDATMLPETFAAMYPRLDEFKALKARLDPNNRLSSSMARRLGIVPDAGAANEPAPPRPEVS